MTEEGDSDSRKDFGNGTKLMGQVVLTGFHLKIGNGYLVQRSRNN